MPRDIPVGNGHLLVNFDDRYQLRDIYFPHVGKENQSAGHPFRLGVWLDGNFSWLTDGWTIDQRYVDDTLATDVALTNASERITIACTDVVDFHEYALVRKFTITNDGGAPAILTLSITTPHFLIVNTSCGASLAPQASCAAEVVFQPIGFGPKRADLEVGSNAADSPQLVSLSGAGCRPVTTPQSRGGPQINCSP